jgi:hypothetical protein
MTVMPRAFATAIMPATMAGSCISVVRFVKKLR